MQAACFLPARQKSRAAEQRDLVWDLYLFMLFGSDPESWL